jgi:hypothetical protein
MMDTDLQHTFWESVAYDRSHNPIVLRSRRFVALALINRTSIRCSLPDHDERTLIKVDLEFHFAFPLSRSEGYI